MYTQHHTASQFPIQREEKVKVESRAGGDDLSGNGNKARGSFTKRSGLRGP